MFSESGWSGLAGAPEFGGQGLPKTVATAVDEMWNGANMAFAVGGQYGEGSLLIKGKPVAYYATAGAAYGMHKDAQYKSEVLLFMTDDALLRLRGQLGWEVGVDATVTRTALDDNGRLDLDSVTGEVVGFIISSEGREDDLSFLGTRVTRIIR